MEFLAWVPELWDDILPIGRLCDRMERSVSPEVCGVADERRGFDVGVDEEAILGMFDAGAFPDGTLDERLDERLPDAPVDEGFADVPVSFPVADIATDKGDTVMFVKNELLDAPLEYEILVGLLGL